MDESTVVQAFAKRLVAAREAKGLTQAQLGEKLGVSQQTVAEWEAGRGFPRPARRDRLAEILGIEIGLPPRFAGLVALSAREETGEFVRQTLLGERLEGQATLSGRPARAWGPHSAVEAAFREALPANLRQYCERSLPFGPNRFVADYMSDKVVAELRMSAMFLPERLYASLWQLVTLAKLAKDHRRFVLIVLPTKPTVGIPQRIQAEAWLHGIEIHIAESPEHAARIIIDLENGTELGGNPPETPSE